MSIMRARYQAVVTKNEDPANPKRGYLFFKSEELTGDPDAEFPLPARPVLQWGMFAIPDIGEEIEIEVSVEDGLGEDVPEQKFLEHADPRWTGARLEAPDGETPAPIASVFTAENYGKRRGFYTPAGHVLMFDDKEGALKVSLAHADGYLLDFEPDGRIMLTGERIWLNAGAEADQFMVRGDELKTWIESTLKVWADTHTHPTAFGPSGPPVGPLSAPPSTILSTAAKVK